MPGTPRPGAWSDVTEAFGRLASLCGRSDDAGAEVGRRPLATHMASRRRMVHPLSGSYPLNGAAVFFTSAVKEEVSRNSLVSIALYRGDMRCTSDVASWSELSGRLKTGSREGERNQGGRGWDGENFRIL